MTSIPWHECDVYSWREKVALTSAETGIVACLQRIDELNPTLNALSFVLRDEALARARQLDKTPPSGRGVLHGVPIVIKDEMPVAEVPTTFGTATQTTRDPGNAWAVQRLLDAGAIIVGKSRMPEFGCWAFTETESKGIVRNPHDLSRTTGGSSGGTAAAVVSGMVPAGMAGDGGGSIRIPAAQCGLFGLKPQRGRVSLAPFPDLWHALGTVGPLTRTVRDSALLYDVISGTADTDSWHAEPIGSLVDACSRELSGLRIGVVQRAFSNGRKACKEHRDEVARVAELLRAQGHEVSDATVRFPNPTLPFLIQFFTGPLAEYELLKDTSLLESRSQAVVRVGKLIPASAIEWAKRRSLAIGKAVDEVFEDYDVLLSPTLGKRPARIPAIRGKGMIGAMVASASSVGFTAFTNISGQPAAHVTTGWAGDGLPIGVQLIGPSNGEEVLVSVAEWLTNSV